MSPTISQKWRTERPAADEFSPYYQGYIDQAKGADLLEEMERQAVAWATMLKDTPEARGGYRYAAGKWSLREVVLHVIDAERVFAFRMLWFARASGSELPGFDENAWVPASAAEERTIADLAAEFGATRRATIAMIKPLQDSAMMRRGKANGKEISSRALAWIIMGHAAHHERVLKERYLVPPAQVPNPAAVTPG